MTLDTEIDAVERIETVLLECVNGRRSLSSERCAFGIEGRHRQVMRHSAILLHFLAGELLHLAQRARTPMLRRARFRLRGLLGLGHHEVTGLLLRFAWLLRW